MPKRSTIYWSSLETILLGALTSKLIWSGGHGPWARPWWTSYALWFWKSCEDCKNYSFSIQSTIVMLGQLSALFVCKYRNYSRKLGIIAQVSFSFLEVHNCFIQCCSTSCFIQWLSSPLVLVLSDIHILDSVMYPCNRNYFKIRVIYFQRFPALRSH